MFPQIQSVSAVAWGVLPGGGAPSRGGLRMSPVHFREMVRRRAKPVLHCPASFTWPAEPGALGLVPEAPGGSSW